MRDGWKKVKGRGTELRFEHESGAIVRIGGSDDCTATVMEQRAEEAMIDAEDRLPTPIQRGEAPAGELKGE